MPDLLILDFDGTLAPLCPHPDEAQLPRSTAEVLQKLQTRIPIALLTGRSVSDLTGKLLNTGVQPQFIVGNHGLEGLPAHSEKRSAALIAVESWLTQLPLQLWENRGIYLENKAYSLSVHYRSVETRSEEVESLHQQLARLTPAPSVIPGKSVLNVLPANSPHKGHAVLALMEATGSQHTVFIGDDVTDERGFEVRNTPELRERPDRKLTTIRVGTSEPTSAEFRLQDPDDVEAYLRALWLRLTSIQTII